LVLVELDVQSKDVEGARSEGVGGRVVVYGVAGEILVDIDCGWILGEDVEVGLVESLGVLQEVVVVEIYNHVGAVEVIETLLVRIGVIQ
jgi:hypothetical protein